MTDGVGVQGMVRRTSAPKNISDEAKAVKNAQIKATMLATKTRRAAMDVHVFTVKVTGNRLNAAQREDISRLFVEAKWLRNAALADDARDTNYAKNHDYTVTVKVGATFEDRHLRVLGSQIAQGVIAELNDNRKALAAAKAKGRKIGRLRFTGHVTSVNLKQHGTTYDVNLTTGRARVQGVRGWFKVRGLDQLPPEAEFANAKLLHKPDGYYLAVTCYTHPKPPTHTPGTVIGVDMNVGRPLVMSDGREVSAYVDETDRLRRLSRKLARQTKGSNNYAKTRTKIRREYQKIDQRRDDLANKVVANLLTNEHVYIQDDNISVWKRRDSKARGSKKIHHGILGRVKARLVNHDRVTVLDRCAPTTAWCRNCHLLTPHDLDQRTYQCANPHCGWAHPDRDQCSAENMILIGTNPDYLVPVERGDIKPVENRPSAKPPRGRKDGSTKQEATPSSGAS